MWDTWRVEHCCSHPVTQKKGKSPDQLYISMTSQYKHFKPGAGQSELEKSKNTHKWLLLLVNLV